MIFEIPGHSSLTRNKKADEVAKRKVEKGG